MTTQNSPQRHAIIGALVADAAAMGLHWLYDQSRIAKLAGSEPAFTETTAADYQGVPSYYAHESKTPGDFSQYGEQAMVMLQSLAGNGGQYRKSHYEQTFCATFGYGGAYVGYIDRPTRDTLNGVSAAETQAILDAQSLPFQGSTSDQQAMINKVLANLRQHQASDLHKAVEEAVRITHDDDAMVAYAQSLIEPLSSTAGFHGANDDQLPAVSKLPALIALHHSDDTLSAMVESAVQVTNNHPLSVESGHIFMQALQRAITTQSMSKTIETVTALSNGNIASIIQQALSRTSEPSTNVVADIGMACNLALGMPGAFHILQSTNSYRDAIETNILAGGDSCGRAILVGALAGAVYGNESNGIPEAWVSKLNRRSEVEHHLDALGL